MNVLKYFFLWVDIILLEMFNGIINDVFKFKIVLLFYITLLKSFHTFDHCTDLVLEYPVIYGQLFTKILLKLCS